MSRGWILHVDLDQYVAAVEIRRRPELRGLPVVVGGSGDPTRPRQVVATASYEARAYGVHSGMPLRLAAKKCPEAVFLPADGAAYDAASVEVMDVLRGFPVVVEVWGWDEAYLGARTDDPEALAQELRTAVLDRTALTCCVGIGDNKLHAKTAVGYAKQGAGVYRITKDTWMAHMGEKPTGALSGVGTKTERKLTELGLHTVADLAAADTDTLAARFGPTMGPWYQRLGRGEGDTTVSSAAWVARSRSKEITYPTDLTDPDAIALQVVELARAVTTEVVAEHRSIARVAVKVRTATFFTRTRITTLPRVTQDPDEVERGALLVLGRFELTRPVRLLGVRVELQPLADD